MNIRNASLLAGLFLVLGAYVYFIEFRKAELSSAAAKRPVLVPLQFEDVDDLEIHYRGDTIAFQKGENDRWRFRDSVRYGKLVPAQEVTTLRVLLAGLRADHVVTEQPDDLAEYGLDKPDLEVKLSTKNGRTATVSLGNLSPKPEFQYWKTADSDTVYLVVSNVGEQVERFAAQPPTY